MSEKIGTSILSKQFKQRQATFLQNLLQPPPKEAIKWFTESLNNPNPDRKRHWRDIIGRSVEDKIFKLGKPLEWEIIKETKTPPPGIPVVENWTTRITEPDRGVRPHNQAGDKVANKIVIGGETFYYIYELQSHDLPIRTSEKERLSTGKMGRAPTEEQRKFLIKELTRIKGILKTTNPVNSRDILILYQVINP